MAFLFWIYTASKRGVFINGSVSFIPMYILSLNIILAYFGIAYGFFKTTLCSIINVGLDGIDIP
jgi:hypothetical protein